MSAQWFRFNWDVQPVPLQTMHCSLLGIEDDCANIIRHLESLQSTVGIIRQVVSIITLAKVVVNEAIPGKLFLIPAFFRFSEEMYRQFFDEEARRITDNFQKFMHAEGRMRHFVMFEMSGQDFDRICAAVSPTVLQQVPFR